MSDNEIPYLRGHGTEFHKMYFTKDLVEYINEVQDVLELSFGDAVRLVVRDSMKKLRIFKGLIANDVITGNEDGVMVLGTGVMEDFHEDLFKDVT